MRLRRLLVAGSCAVLLAGCGSSSPKATSYNDDHPTTQTPQLVPAVAPKHKHAANTSGLAVHVGPDTPSMDKRTRTFMNQINVCQIAVGLVILEAKHAKSDIQMSSDVTDARDTCDGVRTDLATSDTKHFDDQAANAFYAVDRSKSGLNALLAYIDDPRPSKLVEAMNKLHVGDAGAAQALHAINVRRHVYGLKAYKP